MDKSLMQRIAALKAKASAGDAKGIENIVDAISEDDPFIQKLVEKIMSKMQAEGEAGKYRVGPQDTNKKQAALNKVFALLKEAFGPELDGGAAPSPAPALAPSPAAAPAAPAAPVEHPGCDLGGPEVPAALAPVEKLEDEAKSFGDPALDTLVHVIEMLIQKDAPEAKAETPAPFGGDKPAAPAPFGGDKPAAPAPFGEDKPAAPAPFEKKEEAPKAEGGDKPAFPPAKSEGGESEKSEPKAEKSEDASEDKSEGGSEDKSEDKSEEKSEDKSEGDDKKIEAEASARIKALLSLPQDARLAKAAQLRKLAEVVESGEEPAFLKGDDESEKEDKMDKEAVKQALRAALAALEAGDNDKKYTMPAEPEEREEKAEELAKEASAEDRKAKVLAHIAKLRMQKEATVDGKSMATPKEVPTAEGTTESQLSGDAKVQYSPNTSDRPLSTIETKKQKLPTDKAHGDEAEMYFGNNPEAKTEIQTEKDSSKDVNNKRTLRDGENAVYSAEPASPTEHMEKGTGSHQKEKDWETAKSESDKTPSGSRLVGLAAALKLARTAQSKGMVNTEDDFDSLVEKYASLDEEKFAMMQEVIDMAPTASVNRAQVREAVKTVKAENQVFEENDAVQEDGDVEEKTSHEAKLEAAKVKAAELSIRSASQVSKAIRPISESGNNGMNRTASMGKFANFGWTDALQQVADLEDKGLADANYNG